ncbi:MAG: hypothetical protein FGM24_03300 [Candidatus Kapabacteria bacterium]|nr:hypothetical protein [Candidatus Kapabacteria bacterium]
MSTMRTSILAAALWLSSATYALATDLVASKITFDPLPRVERAGRIGLEVVNSGTKASGTFTVRFTVRYEGTVVYQQEASGTSILAESSQNVWTPYNFKPTRRGLHEATAEVVYGAETDPSDNTALGSANPLPGFIPIATATVVLDSVLRARNVPAQAAAFHLRPAKDQADSVISAGAIIRMIDNSDVTLSVPSHVFFVDTDPFAFFGHDVVGVAVPAEIGSAAPVAVFSTQVPFSIDSIAVDPGPYCGVNASRVRGTAGNCSQAEPFSSDRTSNDSLCVLVFTGKTMRDLDDVVIRHDISSFITRLNSNTTGPRVNFGSIIVRRGVNNEGITVAALHDELKGLRSAGCRSVIVKYLGHSTSEGPILSGDGFNNTEILPWASLVDMLRELNAADITIDVTTSRALGIRGRLADSQILGTLIASADSVSTMLSGPGQGTYWERALRVAMSTRDADADGNGYVDVAEAARWTLVTTPPGDSAVRPNPSVTDLNSPLRAAASSLQGWSDPSWVIPADNGSLYVVTEQFSIATKVKAGAARRDTIVRGGYVHIENVGDTRLRADGVYEIIAVRGRGASRNDTVLARLRPQVDAQQRIRIATLPTEWNGIIIRRAPSANGPTIISDSGQVISLREMVMVATNPQYYRTVFQVNDDTSRTYIVGVETGGAAVDSVRLPALVTTRRTSDTRLVIAGALKSDQPGGGSVTVSLTDKETASRTILRSTVLRPMNADSTMLLPTSLSLNDAVVASGTHPVRRIENSYVELSATSTLSADATELRISGANISSTSTTGSPLEWTSAAAGRCNIGGLVLSGVPKLSIAHNDLAIRSMRAGTTALVLRPTGGTHNVSMLGLYGSRGDAVTVDLSGNIKSYVIRGLDVVRPDNFDIRVSGGGIVHCVDCSINLPNTITPNGAAVHLRQTLSAIVNDAAGNPRKGATVDIVSRTGTVLATAVTDEEGFALLDTVLLGSATNRIVDHRPVSIRLTNGDGSTQQRLVGTSFWSQHFFVDSSTVSVAGYAASSPTVMPMPLSEHLTATVVDERGIVEMELIAVTGARVLTQRGDGAQRMALPMQGVAPGMYVLVVTTPGGRSSLPVIVR